LSRSARRGVAGYEDPQFLERLLQEQTGDSSLRVRDVKLTPVGTNHGIISELTSWRRRRRTGLFHCQLTVERSGAVGTRERFDMILKSKASDRDAIDVGETVAATCDAPLAEAFRDYRERIGLTGSHLRELAIYQLPDDRLQRHRPRCFGTWRDDEREEWGLALENLQPLVLMNAVDRPDAWSPTHIDAVIAGLSEIQAVWYGRERELNGADWLGEPPSGDRARALTPLWKALAVHAAPYFANWAGPSVPRIHRQLVETIDQWWRPLEQQPRTLIHNDFSPRNVALRQESHGFRLCAYDWELATLGPPQRDLAEFLCFTLAPTVSAESAASLVERHRSLLETATGQQISRPLWRSGFHSALADLLIDKLAFYAMLNRIRSQRFLPRVVTTWQRLYMVFSREAFP
jgi:hydroxymethylglutaryl-CoA reductase (NADPH)